MPPSAPALPPRRETPMPGDASELRRALVDAINSARSDWVRGATDAG